MAISDYKKIQLPKDKSFVMESEKHNTVFIKKDVLQKQNKTPYKEVKLDKGGHMRSFSKELTYEELTWHQDDDNRLLMPTSGEGKWLLQMEGQHPVVLEEFKRYYVPKGVWHRLINEGANQDLRVLIQHDYEGEFKQVDLKEAKQYPKASIEDVPEKVDEEKGVSYRLGKMKIKIF